MGSKFFYIFLLLLFSISTYSSIEILSPRSHEVVTTNFVTINVKSSSNQGFFLIQDQIIPIRKFFDGYKIPIKPGMNSLKLHVLDSNFVLQPHLSRSFNIYRLVVTDSDLTLRMALFLSEIMIEHDLYMLRNGRFNANDPLTKKDLYAWLVLLTDYGESSQDENLSLYTDLDIYPEYLQLYKTNASILPEPYLKRFYPESYITRQDLINIMLLIQGADEQISTNFIVEKQLSIPVSIQQYIPKDWTYPLEYISKKEGLTVLLEYFSYDHELMLDSIKYELPYPHGTMGRYVEISEHRLFTAFSVARGEVSRFSSYVLNGVNYVMSGVYKGVQFMFIKPMNSLRAFGGSVVSYFNQEVADDQSISNDPADSVVLQNELLLDSVVLKEEPLNDSGNQIIKIIPNVVLRGMNNNEISKSEQMGLAEQPEVSKDELKESKSFGGTQVKVVEHTVLSGDSLPKISKKYYDTYKHWKVLATYNDLTIKERTIKGKVSYAVHIRPGQIIKVPINLFD